MEVEIACHNILRVSSFVLPVWNSDVEHLIAFSVNESFLYVHES